MNDCPSEDGAVPPTGEFKAPLRELRGITPPPQLRDKLRAAVPAEAPDRPDLRAGFPRFGVLRYAAVAAAIVIVASAVVQWHALSSRAPRIMADINDGSGRTAPVDYNSLLPTDINVFDHNTVPGVNTPFSRSEVSLRR